MYSNKQDFVSELDPVNSIIKEDWSRILLIGIKGTNKQIIDVISLGKTIARIREDKDLTQWKLARVLGVSQVRISEIENGRAGQIGINTLASLFSALDVSGLEFIRL